MRDPLGPPSATPARHPDSVFLMGLCLFAGGGLAFAPNQPSALEQALPTWLTTGWAAGLIVGAAAVLVGAFLRDRVTGLLVEFFGRVVLAIGATIYATAFFAVGDGVGGLPDVAPLLVFAVACGWRGYQVLHPVRDALAILRTMRKARDDAEGNQP